MFRIVPNAVYGLSFSTKQPSKRETVIIHILQMWKLRPRKVKEPVEVLLSISSRVGIWTQESNSRFAL